MYCKYCGKEIEEGSAFCPHCGKEQQGNAGTDAGAGTGAGANGAPPYGAPQRPVEQDAPNGGFAVLGFFFPLIGLILYCIDDYLVRGLGRRRRCQHDGALSAAFGRRSCLQGSRSGE